MAVYCFLSFKFQEINQYLSTEKNRGKDKVPDKGLSPSLCNRALGCLSLQGQLFKNGAKKEFKIYILLITTYPFNKNINNWKQTSSFLLFIPDWTAYSLSSSSNGAHQWWHFWKGWKKTNPLLGIQATSDCLCVLHRFWWFSSLLQCGSLMFITKRDVYNITWFIVLKYLKSYDTKKIVVFFISL